MHEVGGVNGMQRLGELDADPDGLGHGQRTILKAVGRTVKKASRRFSAGLIALRPDRDGRIVGYDGVEEVHRRFGEWVIDAHLPSPGTPTQPVEAGYMANAWIRMKHPDFDELRSMLDAVGEIVQVRAG